MDTPTQRHVETPVFAHMAEKCAQTIAECLGTTALFAGLDEVLPILRQLLAFTIRMQGSRRQETMYIYIYVL